MEYVAEIRIELKKGVMDAEGETIQKTLNLLNYKVSKVRTIKAYEVVVEAKDKNDAISKMEDACKRLLANPVIQDYSIKIK